MGNWCCRREKGELLELVSMAETSAQMEESLARNVAYGAYGERTKWMDTDASHLRKPHVMPWIMSPELRQTYHLWHPQTVIWRVAQESQDKDEGWTWGHSTPCFWGFWCTWSRWLQALMRLRMWDFLTIVVSEIQSGFSTPYFLIKVYFLFVCLFFTQMVKQGDLFLVNLSL